MLSEQKTAKVILDQRLWLSQPTHNQCSKRSRRPTLRGGTDQRRRRWLRVRSQGNSIEKSSVVRQFSAG
jgi:hypothetical protein